MSPEFLRQRRNLIGISIIIILFKVAEISTDKLTVLGTTFEIGNPKVIPYFVWTLWVYFLFRYYQYINIEKTFNFVKRLTTKIHNYVEIKIGIKHKDGNLNEKSTNYRIENDGLWKWSYTNQDEVPRKPIQINKFILFLYNLKSIISVSVKTNQFTEFILPLLLAIAAPIIAVSK